MMDEKNSISTGTESIDSGLKVRLSGHTIDADVLQILKQQAQQRTISDQELEVLLLATTPEVISAAYARISRNEKGLNLRELREEAASDVPQARKSNQNIVFEMGHHSIAEHTYLNFDIENLSRLAVEALEHYRLASFTEKSQRYVTFKGDYVTPKELKSQDKRDFHRLIELQNKFYSDAIPSLKQRQEQVNPSLKKRDRENFAKEDARYGISLATQTQLGFSVNARELEYIIRTLRNNPLSEVQELGNQLYASAHELVPSLIQFADKDSFADNGFLHNYRSDITSAVSQYCKDRFGGDLARYDKKYPIVHSSNPKARLLNPKYVDALSLDNLSSDDLIIAALVGSHGRLNNEFLYKIMVLGNDRAETVDANYRIILDGLQHLGKHDTLPREFELADFTFEVTLSAGAFGQLKRHRMATIIPQSYDIGLGFVTPPSLQEVGLKPQLAEIIDRSNQLYLRFCENYPETPIAEYCLTNAHMRNVLVKMNLRDLYHFSRLREDGHAQWEIRDIAHQMCDAVRKVAPITGMLLGGKDQYDEIRGKYYGKPKSE